MALTHAVIFTLADPADAAEAVSRLRSLAGRIPALLGIEAGTSHDGRAPHILLLTTHADAAGLAEYAAHPVHQEFLSWLRPRMADRVALDTVDLG